MSPVDVKVVLLGNEAAGKSSLMRRYVNDRFNDTGVCQNTIGSAFASKVIKINKKEELVLGIWDTAGSERYFSMTRTYYRGAAAAIICYDVTEAEFFNKAKFWIRELRSVEENCKIYLCGTKKDLLSDTCQANPSLETVREYAESMRIKLFITSSKTGENVDIFSELINDYLQNPVHQKKVENFIVLGTESKNSTSRWCCSVL
ncbi:ras-related protein Rab-24 isoform X2 [Copidosoma floridanum]|uniref:ras-related protein Rab-24 isoform X2 n=1 Tax=Copidosoma floridanum TaxID=29053 RepID=UPI0006C96445|nr:ras-related protein Rab-24 isoform X2 [Copidosoma floridanum]